MSIGELRAFVSSTYEDLKEHRTHVIRTLMRSGLVLDPMENWTAEPGEPKKFSQEALARCHLCVLLVAFRRGFVPDGETHSVTQLEYQAAIREGVDVLVYLLDERTAWPDRFNELDTDAEVRAWRRSLETRHGRELFGAAPESVDVGPAITRWLLKRVHPVVLNLSGLATGLAHQASALRERRAEVTSYLQLAHDLVRHTSDELSEGRVPHGACQQIFDTGDRLMSAIGDAVSSEDLARLRELLEGAHQVEMLHDALKDESHRKINLAELDRTRGSLAALIEAIRVSPAGRSV